MECTIFKMQLTSGTANAAQTATFIGILRERPGLLRHGVGPISRETKHLL